MAAARQVYSAYRFCVEIDQLAEAMFSECSGLQAETEVFEWEEGGLNSFKHRLPVRTKYPNLVLKRGIATINLWEWYQQVINGALERRNLSIVLYGYSDQPEVRWNVTGALPIKWSGPTFKSGSTEAAIETFELVHQGFVRSK
ncbi:MAG: phage tail protein [Chloroflexota bacterium]|nr:MAG: phage tail protein [Chloroflexota bacterium]